MTAHGNTTPETEMPRTYTPRDWLGPLLRDAVDIGDYCDAVQAWEADRARIAALEAEADRLRAQRDALVPLARWANEVDEEITEGPWTLRQHGAALATLAAIKAETTTTTTEQTND